MINEVKMLIRLVKYLGDFAEMFPADIKIKVLCSSVTSEHVENIRTKMGGTICWPGTVTSWSLTCSCLRLTRCHL